jgi:D-amino peptidase
MKILISTDIEGVAGVFHHQQVRAGNPEYERARLWMTREANAAIAGAFDAGATEVLVNDSHGDFRNMIPDQLDERALAVLGKPRTLGMMAGVETGADAVCMVGYHSRAQGRGILAHTTNSFAFARVRFNGQEMSEAGMYAALAGDYGVPVVMASGDDAFIAEHQDLLPHVTFVETKKATGQTSGISLSPARACAAIRAGVSAALSKKPRRAKPFVLTGPIVVRVQTQSPAIADLFCQWPALRRIDGDEVEFDAGNAEAAVRMVNSLSAMSAVLR